jgi:sugar phosphate permease
MPAASVFRKGDFTPENRSVLFFLWFGYVFLYMKRGNISVAIPALTAGEGMTRGGMGIVVTSFFWTYAFGQLVSGWLGSRLPARWMMGGSLLLSAICNILMAFAQSVPAMAVIWGVNGAVQSLMWAPLMLVLSRQFEGDRLTAATFSISFTTVFGYLFSWGGSALIVDSLGATWVFLLPGLLTLAFAALFIAKFQAPPARPAQLGAFGVSERGFSGLRSMKGVIAAIIAACMVQGFVRDSLNTWLPTLIGDLEGLLRLSEIAVFLVVPLINFAGVYLSRWVLAKTGGDLFKTIFGFYIAALLPCGALLLAAGMPAVWVVVCMVLLLGLLFSINPLYTSFVPLGFAGLGCVSVMTGLADCAIYAGAGLSGLVTGALLEQSALQPLAALWLALLVLACALALLLRRLSRHRLTNPALHA